jgi:hypothetical protein
MVWSYACDNFGLVVATVMALEQGMCVSTQGVLQYAGLSMQALYVALVPCVIWSICVITV